MEIRGAYNRLCENGVLKEEYKFFERKGLTRALDFPNVFKTEWICIILSRIHDGSLWLEGGPIKTTKRAKTLRSDSKEVTEKNVGAV